MQSHRFTLLIRSCPYVLASVLAVVLGTGASAGVTIVVADDGPADFRTINGALELARAVVPD